LLPSWLLFGGGEEYGVFGYGCGSGSGRGVGGEWDYDDSKPG